MSRNKIILFCLVTLVLFGICVPLHEYCHLWVLQALGGEGKVYWSSPSGFPSFCLPVARATQWPLDYYWLVGLGPMIIPLILIPVGIFFWRKARKEVALPFFIIGGCNGLSAILEAILL